MQKYHQSPADQCAKPPRPEASKSTDRQLPSLGLPDVSPSAFTLSRRRAQRRERDPESCLALLDVFLTLKSRRGTRRDWQSRCRPGGLCCREEGSPSPICAAEGGDTFPPDTFIDFMWEAQQPHPGLKAFFQHLNHF